MLVKSTVVNYALDCYKNNNEFFLTQSPLAQNQECCKIADFVKNIFGTELAIYISELKKRYLKIILLNLLK